MKAFQDTVPDNHCYGCGPENPKGMQIKSYWDGDETVSTLLAALPLALHPEARDAINIGMGSGITSHVLLASRTLESVTTVEIEPAMARLASGFDPRNQRVFVDVGNGPVGAGHDDDVPGRPRVQAHPGEVV